VSLVDLSATALRDAIASKALSPVELMRACLDRIDALNPAVNAICARDDGRAMAVARQAEQQVIRGGPLPPLLGLPLGVKDLQDTAGLLTTHGNVRLRGHVPTHDNALVARLRSAGAIVTAKTNVPDSGAGANTRNPVWGATGNPFNPDLNAGGSSGGSAAALATDMLPLCTGSDTGGSLRIPAALCGVVGLRPSPGLVANDARPLGWSAISVLGPMARDVSDTALMLSACVGPHPMDPLSGPRLTGPLWPLPEVDLSRLRIAFTPDFGTCAVDPMIRRVFAHRISGLAREVAHCEPLDWNLEEGHRCFDVIRAESFLAGFEALSRTDPDSLAPNVRANVAMASSITLSDRAQAHTVQTRLFRQFQRAFESVDLILAPVTPLSPFPWTEPYATRIDGVEQRNYYEWLSLTYLVTLATCPALSLPCGLDELGMPFGLQLIAPLHQDAQLLAMARALETWYGTRPRPDVQVLRTPRPQLKSLVTHPPLPHGDAATALTAV
jgi:Asp-tRNA(Asn)/Glu-tRNA(Gln) amidotransferase A subunit family amidase